MIIFLGALNLARYNRKRFNKKYADRFIQDVDYVELKKGRTHNYKYRMLRDRVVPTSMIGYNIEGKFFRLDRFGLLLIKKDYMWYGPSGPTIDTASFMRSSAVHDVMFQILRDMLIPFERREGFFNIANKDLHKISKIDGMFRIRAYWVYSSVQLFGGKYTIKA